MYITCKCLNISIKIKGGELRSINIDDIELTPNERANIFFKNDLTTTDQVENITKEQPGLVEVRNVGAWTIHRCYNCNMYTHALYKKHETALIIINTNIIMSEEEVAKLKTSPYYSPVFRIIIDLGKIDELDPHEPPSKFSVSQLSSNLRLALGGLEQQLEEAIQHQALLIEERIREYTKQQYQILEEFKERAHSEHSYLARLISDEQKSADDSSNLETPPATPDNNQSHKLSSNDPIDTTAHLPVRNSIRQNSFLKPVKGDHTLNGKVKNGKKWNSLSDYDGEALFEMEGMDDSLTNNLPVSDLESDTDVDSGNEEVYVPRAQRGGYPNLAKSLPVNVPAFESYNRRIMLDDDDDQISRDPMDPHNIQASIKALAKSVHGDTVFGDLPRPRFSTQI